jgi:phage/plasmid-like protein (TIGR03299 family)
MALGYGLDTAFSTARAPWSGIGTKLEGAVTAEEAIVAAGLDWTVAKKNMYLKTPNQGFQGIKGRQALVRTDTWDVLGVFSPRYSPLQNIRAFDGISGVMEDYGAVFHSAGSINGGRRVFIYAELPDTLMVGNDELAKGILLTNSHDGSAAVAMQLMATRKICFNTMNGKFQNGGFRVVHTGNLDVRMRTARDFLGIESRYFQAIEEGAADMHAGELSSPGEFLRKLFGIELDAQEVSTRIQNNMDTVQDLYYHGIGNRGLTRWDMYNAVTEYVDHHRGPATGDELVRVDRRLNSAWFGAGAAMKGKAWELLTASPSLSILNSI